MEPNVRVSTPFHKPFSSIPRFGLASYPTPLERLSRLSSRIGRDLWIKRDDLFGLGFGGNKVRKLDLILREAASAGVDLLITRGGVQSNHCRVTAAAAARLGIKCTLVLTGAESAADVGNVLLDRLFGAEIVLAGEVTDAQADTLMQSIAERHAHEGGRPYVVPLGGGNALGILSYAQAAEEMAVQFKENAIHPDAVILAIGTGSTYAGMALGLWSVAPSCRAIGISVSRPVARLRQEIPGLIAEAMERFDANAAIPDVNLWLFDDYVGPGYSKPSVEGLAAMQLLARTEGIGSDTTYTAKALSGLLALCEQPVLGQAKCVVFLHTGGTPEIFSRDPRVILGS